MKDTGLGEATTKEANATVQTVLTEQPQPTGGTRTRKLYTSFSDEQRAAIGHYTAEHSNTAAVKKFKGDFERGPGESTVQVSRKNIWRNVSERRSKPQQEKFQK